MSFEVVEEYKEYNIFSKKKDMVKLSGGANAFNTTKHLCHGAVSVMVSRRIIKAAEHPHLSISETEAMKSRKQYNQLINRSLMIIAAITDRFIRSMENVVKQTRKVVEIDPYIKTEIVRYKKIWNYTIADISMLAFGTSFPQISLATIDAIRNIGNLYAGGLGPRTLVRSAAFDLFLIHAVCVVVPKAGELKKISDLGVWLVEHFGTAVTLVGLAVYRV
ncbi:hypothetical protein AgCh_017431 [Apium graveolens]